MAEKLGKSEDNNSNTFLLVRQLKSIETSKRAGSPRYKGCFFYCANNRDTSFTVFRWCKGIGIVRAIKTHPL